jgi:hypothetical protein
MQECLLDALLDTLKLLPYLFVTFLLLEFIEHKINSKKLLSKGQKVGPLIGGLLGALPQCGFSAMAANLFAGRVITIGTVVAVFLSTSDEMLPIMLGEQVDFGTILKIIGIKVLIGVTVGFICDLVFCKIFKKQKDHEISHLCKEEHCHCEEHGVVVSSLIHTLKTSAFLLAANILIGLIIYWIGEENLANFLLGSRPLSYLLASLVGLIPNCAGSIIITELYLAGLISLGSMMAGLLTGCGLGLLLLFKNHKNWRENITILAIIYIVGVVAGLIIDLF